MQTLPIIPESSATDALPGPAAAWPESAETTTELPFASLLDQGLIAALLGQEAAGPAEQTAGVFASPAPVLDQDQEPEPEAELVQNAATLWLATDWAAAVAAPAGGGGSDGQKPPVESRLTTAVKEEPVPTSGTAGAAAERPDFNIGRFARSFPPGWEALLAENVKPGDGTAAQSEAAPASADPERTMKGSAPVSLPASPAVEGMPPAVGYSRPANIRIEPPAPEAASQAVDLDSVQTVKPLPAAEPAPETKLKTRAPENAPALSGTESRNALPVERAAVSAAVLRPAAAPLPTPLQILTRMTELQRHATVEYLARAGAMAVTSGQESLTVDLHPPELGRVRIMVEHNGQQVNATLTVQDSSVGNFLQEHGDSLRRSLDQAGVKLGTLSVEIRQDFNGEMKEQEGSDAVPGRWPEDAERLSAARAEKRTRLAAWRTTGSSRVDLMI
jgi:hypothetical protein